ncbi:MAG: hypothetical protein E7464_04570 [Ruminococcaceae bacterium]|nr:hypothetical protein [Oscillospiraceae bacterium]
MKFSLKPKTKIQIIVGILMIAVAVFLGFYLNDMTGPESTMLQRSIYILAVFGVGLSGLCGIFSGLFGFLCGFVLILLIVLPKVLPDPWNRYYAFLYIGLLLLLPLFKKKWAAKKAANQDSLTEEDDEALEDEEFIDEEESALLEALDGKSLIIVQQTTTGRLFQLIRCSGEIRAYRVGGELRGVDMEQVFLNNIPNRDMGKNDFAIPLDTVRTVRCMELANSNPGYDMIAVVKTDKRTYRFAPTYITENAVFEEFWRRNAGTASFSNDKTVDEAAAITPPDKNKLALLKKVKLGYCIYTGAVGLMWLFLNVPYVLFSVLNLLALPIGLALYFCFPNELTMQDQKKSKGSRISIAMPVMLSGCVIALRTFIDFNILHWGKFFIAGGILLVILLVLFLCLSREWRSRKGTIFIIVFALLFYVIGAVGQINYVFDPAPPQIDSGEVVDMHISTSSKGPDTYHINVLLQDGTELDLQTSEANYETISIGDETQVYTFPGLLGIEYAFLEG